MTESIGLYVHIPFCHARCGYCDFATYVGHDSSADAYLTAIQSEIASLPRYPVKTLFIGGGTPTTLTVPQIHRLFSMLRDHFDFSVLVEATVEANPESSTDECLIAYRSGGINRLSFGLQSSDDRRLKKMDRIHTFGQFRERYQRARQLGFENINIDLIYGFDGQDLLEWRRTLSDVLALQPEHVSAYALKIEEGTRFYRDQEEVDHDLEAEMYLVAADMLRHAGYHHYEISNFSMPGRESLHNQLYWTNETTIGIGISAASHEKTRRWKNTRGLLDYLAGNRRVEETELTPDEQEREDVMLRLRLSEGVDIDRLDRMRLPVIRQFEELGYAQRVNHRFRLTPRGWLMSNQLFQHFV